MDDEAVEIMYSEESEASQLRLLKSIENWASKESQRSEMEMTGFGAALSNDLVNFEKFTAKDCRQCPKLIGALSAVKQHIDKQFKNNSSDFYHQFRNESGDATYFISNDGYLVKRENKSRGLTALSSDDFSTAESNTYPVAATTWQSAS